MDVKEDILQFFGFGQSASNNSAYKVIHGLCDICDNNSHCTWVENKKTNCEHYE